MLHATPEKVFLSLGGNLGPTYEIFKKALNLISEIDHTKFIKSSSIYLTSPVSVVPQFTYMNMVCCLETTLEPKIFFSYIESIEIKLGKKKKEKDLPRLIDIDILFFGERKLTDPDLIIPHPEWNKRLFVLKPLLDLIDHIMIEKEIIDLKEIMNRFENKEKEVVTLFL